MKKMVFMGFCFVFLFSSAMFTFGQRRQQVTCLSLVSDREYVNDVSAVYITETTYTVGYQISVHYKNGSSEWYYLENGRVISGGVEYNVTLQIYGQIYSGYKGEAYSSGSVLTIYIKQNGRTAISMTLQG